MVNAIGCTPAPRIGPARDTRPWPAHLRVPGLAPSAAESLASEPVRIWIANSGRGFAGPPAVGDSVIVVQATDPRLVVLDRASGRQMWSYRVDGLGTAGPLLDADRIYTATSGGQVVAVRLRTGHAIWKREVQPVAGPIALGLTRLFIVGAPSRLYALNRTNGTVAWRHDFEGVLRAGPTLAGGRLVVASDDSLYEVDPTDGRLMRTVAARGLALNPPAVTDSLVIYASPDGFVAAYNLGELAQAWRVELGAPILGSPAVARDTIFAATIAGAVWRIPLLAPATASHVDLGVPIRASPAPIADGVLIGTVAGELMRFSGDSPEPRWQVRVDGPIDQAPIVDRGLLIFTDGRGRIHVWK